MNGPTALVYDERRGCFSVGAHVRDAACYVCWAFARAYSPQVLRKYVTDSLAPALLVTAVFDREVNCRRAASAAFQENVGRLGADAVPHGIELLTTCDYHSVGLRAVAYTELSVKVAKMSNVYAEKLVEHLLEHKISHWDNSVRELTGQALRKLAPITKDLMIKTAIPTLLKNLDETKDLYTRHGSLVAVGGLVIGLTESLKDKDRQSLQDCFDKETLDRLKNILMVMEQRMELRGSAGELLRSSVTPFIQNMSEARFPCHQDDAIIDLWKMIIDDNLAYKDPVAQERAIQAVGPFVNEYFPPEKLGQILEHYLSSLDQSELHRRGFSLALGNLPKTVLKGHLDKVLSVLIEKTKITKTTEVWAEARRDVIKAIINIIKTMGVSQGHNGN